jgi:hypothetical protein
MAAAVKSDNAGGKFGHMHLILKEKEYRIATKNTAATVGLIKMPPDINPEFQLLKKYKFTKYKVLQLGAEARCRTRTAISPDTTTLYFLSHSYACKFPSNFFVQASDPSIKSMQNCTRPVGQPQVYTRGYGSVLS